MKNCSRTVRDQKTPNAVCAVSLALGIALVAGQMTTAGSLSAQGRNKPTNVSAAVTVDAGVGGAIASDGAPYVDGVAGVLCQLLSGGSLTLNLQSTARRLNFDLSGRISGSGPTGSLSDDAPMSISDIASMAIGSNKLTRVIFNTSIGQFNFDTTADGLTSSVSVTRDSPTTWVVETTAGDVAVLVRPDPSRPNRSVKVGYYHLPFKLSVVSQ